MTVEQINITVGTAGHIDHGKTALIRNLTGCDTDRLKAEKERGMSIDLGFAPCAIHDREVGIVDVPGHENFIRTMVAGATSMDGCILVVAADDAVMPQSREHLDILTLLGVEHGIVAITKIDRVEEDALQHVRDEVEALVRGTFLEGAPALAVSNTTGQGFGDFRRALEALVQSIERRPTAGLFRLPVERAFSLPGYGAVVSGIPVSGAIRTGDEVVLLPQGRTGRVRAIEVYGRQSTQALAGQCAALNIRHWDHTTIERGDALVTAGTFEPATWYAARVQLLAHEKAALKNGVRARLHVGTSEAVAAVYLMDGEALRPGGTALVQMKLDRELVAGPGDRFILRRLSPAETMGGGYLIEALGRRLKRAKAHVREDLAERADAVRDAKAFVDYCVKTSPQPATGADAVARRVKAPKEDVDRLLAELAALGRLLRLADGRYIHCETVDDLERRITRHLADVHERSPESLGPTLDELAAALDEDRSVVAAMVELFVRRGALAEQGGRVSLVGHEVTLDSEERTLVENVEGLFRGRLFQPPEVEDLAADLDAPADAIQRAIGILLEDGRLVRVPPKLLFHGEAIERGEGILRSYFEVEERLESVRFKYLLDTTRKFAIPLLDFFDRLGVTRRVGNTRYLKQR